MPKKISHDPDVRGQSAQDTKSGFFKTIFKRKGRVYSGRLQIHPDQAPTSRSKTKVMLISCFDMLDLVHCEFVPEVETVNQHFYQ